jgi:GntR family transcriptional regulator
MKGVIMRIIINHSSMIPIYEQIVDQIKKQINDHILQENDPLPSVRLLSKELRISALAVNKDLLEEAKKEIEEYLEKALQKAKQSGVSHKEVKELLELLMEE